METSYFLPSMMCASYDCLQKEVQQLDKAGVDMFHCDVMDGHFVDNIGMGLYDVQCVCKNTKKPVDVHLMMDDPGRHISLFTDIGVNIIYVHYEADRYIAKTLQTIRENGAKAGLVISPHIAVETVKSLLPICDYVLVMSVHPGYAGQKFLEYTVDKIRALVELKPQYKYEIIIDGACSPQRIKELTIIGADGFVLGTSALFGKCENYQEGIKELRACM